MLYPLRFKPILKEKIWGGDKLRAELLKFDNALNSIGESWEISGLESDLSVVTDGFLAGNNLQELIEVYMGDLVGETVYEKFGLSFPLLVKFIDANKDLSIQVHPNNEVAKERHAAYGKSEAWYCMDGGKGQKLVSGFKNDFDISTFDDFIANGNFDNVLNWVAVEKGDVFYLPAGRVHTIGSGNLILEIQQSSDVTYRIFDYNRVDGLGNKRELHTELAKDVIDTKKTTHAKVDYERTVDGHAELVNCEHFVINLVDVTSERERDYYLLDSFVIVVCVEGELKISGDDFDSISLKKVNLPYYLPF